MFHLLQKHTVDLYQLEGKNFEKEIVEAKSLLNVCRFDLFAKLFYIRNRERNKDLALRVYNEHIKSFNPDLKEPGRTDKNSLNDFVNAFDVLIDYFKDNEFDELISLVPVSESGIILDASHRIAALAYYNKKVTILKFKEVEPVCHFDYLYFQKRGLSSFSADKITIEALNFTENIYMACLWPKMGSVKDRGFAVDHFDEHFKVLYSKNMSMSLNNLSAFILETYKHQDWVGTEDNKYAGAKNKALNCYDTNKTIKFVLFQSDSLKLVEETKEVIRKYYGLGKHVIHITDDQEETEDMASIIFTEKSDRFRTDYTKFSDILIEYRNLLKNKYLLNLKITIVKYLNKIGLYLK